MNHDQSSVVSYHETTVKGELSCSQHKGHSGSRGGLTHHSHSADLQELQPHSVLCLKLLQGRMFASYQQVYHTLSLTSNPGPVCSYLSMTGLEAIFTHHTNIITLG